ncbi:MAG TPA: hypothetical protein VF655_06515, partial [Allosphingosinicella sp.]
MTLSQRTSTSALGPKPVLSAAAGGVEGLGTNEIVGTTTPLDHVSDFPAIPAGWSYLDTAATAQ